MCPGARPCDAALWARRACAFAAEAKKTPEQIAAEQKAARDEAAKAKDAQGGRAVFRGGLPGPRVQTFACAHNYSGSATQRAPPSGRKSKHA